MADDLGEISKWSRFHSQKIVFSEEEEPEMAHQSPVTPHQCFISLELLQNGPGLRTSEIGSL